MSTKTETHLVPPGIAGLRLSDYAAGIFLSRPSRKGVKKATDDGCVQVNGHTANTATRIHTGDLITLSIRTQPMCIDAKKLQVVFEDDQLAVVLKPHGMPCSGNLSGTLTQCLTASLQPSHAVDAMTQAYPAHRLDRDTGGLILVGKTQNCLESLNKLFELRQVDKHYEALVVGIPEQHTIHSPLEGKSAETKVKVQSSAPHKHYGSISYVELSPKTGRTHQLRIHLSSIGHPILGDRLYGNPEQLVTGRGLFLYATRLAFRHPVSGESLEFSVPASPKFTKYMMISPATHT